MAAPSTKQILPAVTRGVCPLLQPVLRDQCVLHVWLRATASFRVPTCETEQAARAQVVDTVELFHFRRQRKLSLRFLAHQLLGVGIQATSHDSIVDARTALQLFQARLP